LSSKTIVEYDGKRFSRTVLPSGAIIDSEIVEPKEYQTMDTKEYMLLIKIAEKLGIEVE